EQVIPAALQVSELLKAAPSLKVLITSRTALRIYGEHELPVPGMKVPALKSKVQSPQAEDVGLWTLEPGLERYEAVRLFIERAQAVKPDFEVTQENARAVAEICLHVDG